MKALPALLAALLLAGTGPVALADDAAAGRKRLVLLDIFDAGQPQAVILKLYDPDAGVICYVLMPEKEARKQVGSSLIYEGNNIGSISCVPVAVKQAGPVR